MKNKVSSNISSTVTDAVTIILYASTILSFIACTPRMDQKDVVAIDGKVYSSDEFFTDVVEPKFASLDVSRRREVVKEFARQKIIIIESENRELPKQEMMAQILRGLKENLIVDTIIEEEVWTPLLSDSSLKLLYDRLSREVGVYHIVITYKDSRHSKSDRSEEEAYTLAMDIRKRIMKGELTFEEAAERYSEDPSRQKGGELGYFRWGKLFEPVQSVAFSLKRREISEPVKSDVGYHLVWVIASTPIPQLPYEEIIPQLRKFIRKGLGREFDLALDRFEVRLRNRYRVNFNDDTIKKMLIDIMRVHGDQERSPKVSEIQNIEVGGIVCTIDGEPYDVNWFKERIKLSGMLFPQSLVFSKGSLMTTLEHILNRFLTVQFAKEERDELWHLNIERKARRKRFNVLKKKLIELLAEENPEASEDELLQSVITKYKIEINEDFIKSYSSST